MVSPFWKWCLVAVYGLALTYAVLNAHHEPRTPPPKAAPPPKEEPLDIVIDSSAPAPVNMGPIISNYDLSQPVQP